MYSGVIVRCFLTASTLAGGKAGAKKVMAAVAAHREECEFERHCCGPNLGATPNDIIARIETYSGIDLVEDDSGHPVPRRSAQPPTAIRVVQLRM